MTAVHQVLADMNLGMFDPEDHKSIKRSARKAMARNARRNNKVTHGQSSFVVEPLRARNENQAAYMEMLETEDQVFAIGPAGTGKTYVAARTAIRRLLDRKIDHIMIGRPSVGKAKHKLGYRPGKQDDKVEDWMVPILQGFKAECSATTLDALRRAKKIEFLAFETLRGRSLENAFIILDEAQNCDLGDLKMFLTRQGEGSSVVVCGDLDQLDIPDSGLDAIISMVYDDRNDIDADVIEFTDDDVVRSPRVKQWVKAFRLYEAQTGGD